MKPTEVKIMGMMLDQWKYESCTAHFGYGDNWATLYHIRSKEEGKGHATQLLRRAKEYYEEQGKLVGGTYALAPQMKHIYQKLFIKEYE